MRSGKVRNIRTKPSRFGFPITFASMDCNSSNNFRGGGKNDSYSNPLVKRLSSFQNYQEVLRQIVAIWI